MSYMLSVSLNIPHVELESVGQLLAAIKAQGGQIEDVSLHFIPENPAAIQAENQTNVGNGTAQVLALVPMTAAEKTTRRSHHRKPTEASGENQPGGATPSPQPQVGDNSGSCETGPSTLACQPTAVVATVGANEGAALPTGVVSGSVGVAPSSNVVPVEEVRAWCAQAVQADGSRRLPLTKLLGEYGSASISALPEDKRDEFYERVQKELK